jgi:hypothetical protein
MALTTNKIKRETICNHAKNSCGKKHAFKKAILDDSMAGKAQRKTLTVCKYVVIK